MLSRPEYRDEKICELKTIIIDFPTRTANELRTEQLKDLELKKIIDCFENPNKGVDFANWTGRGYVMNQEVLYRYSPHAEVKEVQLVVPTHERENILKLHHDAPTAAHYGADGTFSRISSKYYWTGMRKFIADYVKSCSECIRYKATNQKPAALLQTPVPAQRFESIAIDLFWFLTETTEDKSRRPSPNYKVNDLVWVKLHPLSKASQNRSAKLMPRRDGPYIVLPQRSPTTFVVASCDKPDEPLGVYHTSALTPFLNGTETQSPVVPLKKRGRPRKQPLISIGTAGENAKMSASTPPRRDGLRRCRGRIDQEDHEERGSKDRGASTCGPHSDSFNDLSKRRRSNYSTNNFQTLAKANLKSKRPPCTLFNTRTSATASIVVPSQINVECHRLA
ncbi:retrovirus-related Pol polyprotein from transposon 412 [Trichonephila clavipes]|nr:retrovirus-related Pol polyprotein from transposon 412 [Trichonephila clavipes]